MRGVPIAEAIARSGWIRSLGGTNPYLALWTRTGTSVADADQALESNEILELPCARGCVHLVSKPDYELALQVGAPFSSGMDTARRHLGVTDQEVAILADRILAALGEHGPLDPRGMKKHVGDAVRDLGAEGKKRGQTTTLSLGIQKLQSSGRIRRIPTTGKLDTQSYAYELWPDGPQIDLLRLDGASALAELASKFFTWVGPATVKQFQWFSGSTVAASKEACAPLNLQPVCGDLMLPESRCSEYAAFSMPQSPQLAFVGGMDSVLVHQRDLGMVHDDPGSLQMAGEKGLVTCGQGLSELTNNAIFDRGSLIGFWEYDPFEKQLIWFTFEKPGPEVRDQAERTEAFIRDELGDMRSFSLDSPESRKPKLALLRTLASR